MALPGKRVLVVEDSDLVARSLVLMLVHDGHIVEIAASGADALALAPSFAAHVAIIDLGLPDMRGDEVARHLRALGSPPRLVAITGASLAALSAAQREPFDAVLGKPFGYDDLAKLL